MQNELAYYAERENGRTKSNYNPGRQCIELELERHLDDEEQELLSSQFTLPADYDGESDNGSMFVIYPW